MEIIIRNRDDGIEVNGSIFSQSEFEKIETRISNNSFSGERSHVSNGVFVRRESGELVLSRPDIYPKESWSLSQWVEESDGWRDYTRGTQEEWMNAFSEFN